MPGNLGVKISIVYLRVCRSINHGRRLRGMNPRRQHVLLGDAQDDLSVGDTSVLEIVVLERSCGDCFRARL